MPVQPLGSQRAILEHVVSNMTRRNYNQPVFAVCLSGPVPNLATPYAADFEGASGVCWFGRCMFSSPAGDVEKLLVVKAIFVDTISPQAALDHGAAKVL